MKNSNLDYNNTNEKRKKKKIEIKHSNPDYNNTNPATNNSIPDYNNTNEK